MAIGALAVRVTADTSQYNKRMGKTAGPANAMRKRLGTVAKASGKMAAALAAAGVAITTALVKKGLAAVDAASKLSRVLGTTTAGVQAMNRAAELSGIATEKMQQNMRAYTKRLGEAVQGTGEAKNALAALGLNAQELAEMPLDQQMKVIGERLDGVATASEKAAIMSDLFSRSGVDMVNVFENGGAVLDKARKEVTAFGVAVSDVDAATIERTNDAFSTIGTVIQGIANRLAVKFAPIIEAIANKFRAVAMETNGFQGVLETAFSVGVKAVGFFADMLRGLHVVIKGVLVGFQGLGTGIISVASMVWEGWQRIFEKIVAGIQMAAEQINKIPFVPDIPLDGIKAYREQLRGSADDQVALRDRMQNSLAQSATELKELAQTPMPSDKLDAFVKSVTEASGRISEKTVKARKNLGNLANPTGGEDGADGEDKKSMKDQLDRMRARLEGEREIIKLDYEKKLEQLQIFRENKLVTDTEYDELEKQLEDEKQKKLTDVAKKGAEARAKAEEEAAQRQRDATVNAMNNIVSAVGSGSKKAFKIQQAASISTAVIKGWEAAVNAWNAGMSTGGPYAPAIAAAYTAASLAKTGAQIASIKSQSFGSGGSTGGGGGGGGGIPSAGGAANARTDTGGGGGTGASYDVTLALQGGSTISDDQLEGVVNRIGEFFKDGGTVSGMRMVRE